MQAVTIAGFETYPSKIDPRPMWMGGQVRRSLDGTGYRKGLPPKIRLALTWEYLTADEAQIIRVIFAQALAGAVQITCENPAINGNFLFSGDELALEPLEGEDELFQASMTFEER